MKLTTPKVYLIAKTAVVPGALDDWLLEIDAKECQNHISGTDGERIIEYAGRRCYKAYKPGLNPNVKKIRTDSAEYHENILKSGHGSVIEHTSATFAFEYVSRVFTHEIVRNRAGMAFCLAGDTLLYSEHMYRGRRSGTTKRKVSDIWAMQQKSKQTASRLAMMKLRCLDEETGEFATSPIKRIHRSGIQTCFCVTLEDGKTITCSADHKFLGRRGWQPLRELCGGLSVSKGLIAVYGDLGEIKVNGKLAYRDEAWLKDQYHAQNNPIATIAESAGVSYHTIRVWLKRYGLQHRPKGRPAWNEGKHYKHVTPWTEAKRKLFSEMKTGEGNLQWRGGVTCKAIAVRKIVNKFRKGVYERDNYTCRLCGVRGGKLEVHHEVPLWTDPDNPERLNTVENLVTLCSGCHRGKVNNHELEYVGKFNSRPLAVGPVKVQPPGCAPKFIPVFKKIVSVTYAGELETYDVELPGPHHNFVANGIITHNSQESLRYVRLTDLGFSIPECVASNPEAVKIFEETVANLEQQQIKLSNLFNIDNMNDFDGKKILTSAFRRIAPIGLSTGIIVTFNMRALRWTIQQRTSLAAEAEMRAIMDKVAEIAVKEWPYIFQDFSRNEEGEWVPKYAKV